MPTEDADSALIARLRQGEDAALGSLFDAQRSRLRRIVAFRLDPLLAGRIDPEDVVQEAYLAAAKRLPHFRERPEMSFTVWMRLITIQTLADVVRRHCAAQKRDVHAEVSLDAIVGRVDDTAASFAGYLLSRVTSPSRAAARIEISARIDEALQELSDTDREILALRHFEELTNNEAAEVLNIHKAASTNRYLRALRRLEAALVKFPELKDLL